MRPILLLLLLPLAGCAGGRTLTPPPTADPAAVAVGRADHRLAVHLGPRMLQVALPLLLARAAPHLPLYLRHLDGLSLHLYAVPDDAPPLATALRASSWEVVLRVREDNANIWLLHAPASPALDRFYLIVDDGDERIVAYAEGRLLPFLRFAIAANT